MGKLRRLKGGLNALGNEPIMRDKSDYLRSRGHIPPRGEVSAKLAERDGGEDLDYTDLIEVGNALAFRKDYVQAAKELGNAIALKDTADARIRRGIAYEGAGDADAAIADYESALVLSPKNQDAHWFLGQLLEKEGRADDAAVHKERARESGVTELRKVRD